MKLLETLHRNLRTLAMPAMMVVGALFCHPIARVEVAARGMIIPILIFAMLFITFCRVKISEMRPSMMHLWLLLFQAVVCVAVYLALCSFSEVVAQGAMVCVLAPVAMAAVVIAGMLGANIATMATYSLICNMAVALLAPVMLTLTGNGECTFAEILMRIAPLLVGPFFAAQFCRWVLPRVAQWIGSHGQVSFYLWLASLMFVIGRTTAFILAQHDVLISTELALALVAGVICVVQFKVGRRLGRRYGDPAAGGQSLGQKNTVLAIWMAQQFLDPISSIAPTAYIVWQNIVNSWQLYRHDKVARR